MSRLISTLILLAAMARPATALTLRSFTPPARTTWVPEGCRLVPSSHPLLADRTVYRNLHANAWNSAEVSLALAPVLGVDWTVETDKWTPTGAMFDRAGNVYFSPLWPGEPVVLVSLDPATGARRWAIPGSAPSGSSPFIAPDPDDPTADIIYLSLYEEALAVRPDGSVVWRRPTGLSYGAGSATFAAFGFNYHPGADALVADTGDGRLYVLDRRTGEQLLGTPFSLPGGPSPPAATPGLPPAFVDAINLELRPLIAGAPPTLGFSELVQILLGGRSEVANFFSIDPFTGRMWVAATAPDVEDGVADGVSELGALYGLDLVTSGGPPYTIVEACHVYFTGGSASTPALRADGTRIYAGDSTRNLIAYDAACQEMWRLDVGQQITGAIGVSSDNGELYASGGGTLTKVIDRGAAGEIVWQARYDMYDLATGESTFHLLLPAIGANGLLAGAGGGRVAGATPLPTGVGIAHIDRDTGTLRSYVEGPEESVAVISTGPDGGVYLTNSPIRRAVSRVLFGTGTPLIGGITKYGPRRLGLLARDALCAGADRAKNAARQRRRCPVSVEADRQQLVDLVAQARRVTAVAAAQGELTNAERHRIERRARNAATRLRRGGLATGSLGALCRFIERRTR